MDTSILVCRVCGEVKEQSKFANSQVCIRCAVKSVIRQKAWVSLLKSKKVSELEKVHKLIDILKDEAKFKFERGIYSDGLYESISTFGNFVKAVSTASEILNEHKDDLKSVDDAVMLLRLKMPSVFEKELEILLAYIDEVSQTKTFKGCSIQNKNKKEVRLDEIDGCGV